MFRATTDAIVWSGLDHFDSNWVPCDWCDLLIFQVEWTATANPVGVLSLQGNSDATVSTPLSGTGPSFGVPIPVLDGFYGAWPNVAAPYTPQASLVAILVIENPLRFHRVHYERGSGGNNNQFTISRLQRGRSR